MKAWVLLIIFTGAGCAHNRVSAPILRSDVCQITESRSTSPRGRSIRFRALIESSAHGTLAIDPHCDRALVILAPANIIRSDEFKEMQRVGMPAEGNVLVELTGVLTWSRKARSPTLTLTETPFLLFEEGELIED